MASFNEENRAAPQREEASFQSKYGGISPKKPLINKDHERAYFDSADWVLGKQGASSSSTTVPAAEPLKPKLQASFQSKYGGISPKKPLISKDHERAYFDSPDWVLGKQGASSNSTTVPAAEPLKPKLQRTAYHQLPPRRPACTSE